MKFNFTDSMTVLQFNKLKETEQFNVLLTHGVIVAKRSNKKYKYVLYQVDNIYIELQYLKNQKTMPDVRGFTCSGKSLLPYIENIDLSELSIR